MPATTTNAVPISTSIKLRADAPMIRSIIARLRHWSATAAPI
jgi:hypothetical protein